MRKFARKTRKNGLLGGILGFTLTEVLAVVIILGILAALVLPRFAFASERVIAGEGINMLGALRRAQLGLADGRGNFLYLPEYRPSRPSPEALAAWARLGLAPLSNSSRFSYRCTTLLRQCTATRRSPAVQGEGLITINLATGVITPHGSYIVQNGTIIGMDPGPVIVGGLSPVTLCPPTLVDVLERILIEKHLTEDDIPPDVIRDIWILSHPPPTKKTLGKSLIDWMCTPGPMCLPPRGVIPRIEDLPDGI